MNECAEYTRAMAFLKKAVLINGTALVCFVIRMAQTILLSRWLGPASIGQYALVTSVLMLAAQVWALGLPIAFLYHSQHDPKQAQSYQTNCIWAGSLLGVVGGLATGLLVCTVKAILVQCPGMDAWPSDSMSCS